MDPETERERVDRYPRVTVPEPGEARVHELKRSTG